MLEALNVVTAEKNAAQVFRNFRDITPAEILDLYQEPLIGAFRSIVSEDFHAEFENEAIDLLADILRRNISSEGVRGCFETFTA